MEILLRNELISNGFKMSIDEKRLLFLAMSKIHLKTLVDSEEVKARVSVSEWVELYKEDKKKDAKHCYRDMKEAARELMHRTIEIGKKSQFYKHYDIINITDSCRYVDNEAIVVITFARSFLKCLYIENGNFTPVCLGNISKLSSSSSCTIYLLLTRWLHSNEYPYIDISIYDIKKTLGIEKKYPIYSDFKKRVIDPCMEDINKNTDLFFYYYPIKTKQKITHYRFSVKKSEEQTQLELKNFQLKGE